MSSDNIYIMYNIDKTKLSRDYLKYPLKKFIKQSMEYEQIPYTDLKYLYLERNISIRNISKILGCSRNPITSWINKYQLIKDKKTIFNSRLSSYKNTCIKKYGVPFHTQTATFINKMQKTRKQNKTFNTSKPEEEIYKLLCEKYTDVKRQYKSEKYPFACDFYIPEIDTYIEYQGWWGHGKEPYIGSKEQQEKIKLWESKKTSQYNSAIKNWTYTDPLKRNIAIKNNIHLLEFFNMNEFIQWYHL